MFLRVLVEVLLGFFLCFGMFYVFLLQSGVEVLCFS